MKSNKDDPGKSIVTRKATGQLDENPDDKNELKEEDNQKNGLEKSVRLEESPKTITASRACRAEGGINMPTGSESNLVI